jgi:hypothetical protein
MVGTQALVKKHIFKLLMNKVENGNSTQTKKIWWGNMHPICINECALKIFFHTLSHILCPKVWTCILYIWAKGKHMCITLFVLKCFLKNKNWGTNKNIGIFFVKGQAKWLITKNKS